MAGSTVVLVVEREPRLPLVLADRTQMQEVLTNLLLNRVVPESSRAGL